MKTYILENFWDIVIYAAVAITVFSQIVIGWQYYIGQGGFLIANILYLIRDVKLKRPQSDIVKDIIFSALTIGCILVYSLSM